MCRNGKRCTVYLRKKHLRVFWLLDRPDIYCSPAVQSRNPVVNVSMRNLLSKISQDKYCTSWKFVVKRAFSIQLIHEQPKDAWGKKRPGRTLVVRKTSFRLKVIKVRYCLRYVRRVCIRFNVIYTDFFSFVSYSVRTIDRLQYFPTTLPACGEIEQFQLMKNISQSGLHGY